MIIGEIFEARPTGLAQCERTEIDTGIKAVEVVQKHRLWDVVRLVLTTVLRIRKTRHEDG